MLNRITENVIALYAVQACTYALPLITFPYLARTLGPSGWGAVLFAQSIGGLIAIVVEYGFDYSATRETARNLTDKSRLRDLLAGVIGAKGVLALLCVFIAFLSRPLTLTVAPSLALFWSSTIWGVAQGINMLWYFQGQQRMRLAGAIEVGGKLVATLSIFLVVRRPEDGWKVMAAQAIGCVIAHGITVIIGYREVGFRLPDRHLIENALRVGWSLFLFRASQSLLTTANGVILGFFGSPVALGLYAGADKIALVSRQALWPLNQALFPHQATEMQINPEAGLRNMLRSLKYLGALGVCAGLVLIFGAPLLVRIGLGQAFEPSIPTLRVLGVLTPLSAVGTVLGFQWLLPLGMDRQFNQVIFGTGLAHLVIASALAAKFGSTGMAVAVVLSQIAILICFILLFRRSRRELFACESRSTEPESVTANTGPAA